MNAVKTSFAGRTVLLPSDDAEAYRQHLTAYANEFKPVGLRECELVQSLVDIQWPLQRIPGLEMAIYARGRDEFAEQFEDLDPAACSARLDLETFIHYQSHYVICSFRKDACTVSAKRTWPNSANYSRSAVNPRKPEPHS